MAVAVVHNPEILILDEPTSGVDPVARDDFWQLLIELSREQGVTIFISTHFMDEAARCDRISLMHAGRILASNTPAGLCETRQAETLEEAFIGYLEEAVAKSSSASTPPAALPVTQGADDDESALAARPTAHKNTAKTSFSLLRLFGYAHREALELWRDRIRLTFALLGSIILMFILGYGITFDVEDLSFAVLDQDQTAQSRDYIQNIAGSRYFIQRADIKSPAN